MCYGRPGQQGIQTVNQLPFWCALVKRTTIDKIGVLDEAFIHYGSDNWYCKTAREHKIQCIWVRDVFLTHRQHGSGLINKWRVHDQQILAKRMRGRPR
jgi:GT2 family glycosyltransferase